jgi:hypothetical protein
MTALGALTDFAPGQVFPKTPCSRWWPAPSITVGRRCGSRRCAASPATRGTHGGVARVPAAPAACERGQPGAVLFASPDERRVRRPAEGLARNAFCARMTTASRRSCAAIAMPSTAGKGSVIFGLASFAEGVDLPGSYCAHVVIAKLPFAVPDDPVDAALRNGWRRRGATPSWRSACPTRRCAWCRPAAGCCARRGPTGAHHAARPPDAYAPLRAGDSRFLPPFTRRDET